MLEFFELCSSSNEVEVKNLSNFPKSHTMFSKKIQRQFVNSFFFYAVENYSDVDSLSEKMVQHSQIATNRKCFRAIGNHVFERLETD